MKIKLFLIHSLLITLFFNCSKKDETSNISIQVSISDSLNIESIDGRLLLMLSTNDEDEPRFQIKEGVKSQIIFGVNVNQLKSGQKVSFDNHVFGYPIENLSLLKPGTYYVQALLHVYETFNLANGKTVKLPMDNGEGQQWNKSPGNIYSNPTKVQINVSDNKEIHIVMSEIISEIEEPKDTDWIKHIKFKSEKLSEFWGRDMYLGAHVLLPKGFFMAIFLQILVVSELYLQIQI